MAGLDVKVSQLGEVVVASDNDLLNLVTYDEQNQTYVSGKVKASTMKDYMIGDTDISGLGDGTPTGAIDALDDEIDANYAEWKTQWKKNGAYNLCGSKYTTEVDNGITFTANSDGSVTTSGSVGSGRTYSILIGSKFTLKAGTYVLGFNPVTGAGGRHTAITLINAGTSSVIKTIDTLEKDTFTLASDVTCYAQLVCYGTGESYSVTFKPMITTDLNATYDDFVKPAMTNLELTEVNNTYASYGLNGYSANGCTVYATGVRIGNFAVLQGKWFKSTGLTKPTSFISSLPSALLPYEDTTGSGIYIIKSSGAIETGLPKVTTSGNVFESATSTELTEGSFSIVYRAK